MKKPLIHDFSMMLHVAYKIIPEHQFKNILFMIDNFLAEHCSKSLVYYKNNLALVSAFNFISEVIKIYKNELQKHETC